MPPARPTASCTRSALRSFVTVDDPNGVGTTIVNGINDDGKLVGFYGTAPINTGFVASPSGAEASVRGVVEPSIRAAEAIRR